MSPTKKFLLIYAAVYLPLAIGINVAFGPPGFTPDYLEENQAQHDRYLDGVKRDAYKIWTERPELNPPDEALSALIAFVEEYEGREDFIGEQKRRSLYVIFFDCFNVTMLIVLVVRFARKPLAAAIDAMIEQVRTRIEKAEGAQAGAAQRKKTVEDRLAGIDSERERILRETAQQVDLERAAIEEGTAVALAQFEQELEDRKRAEELKARNAMKAELVDEAIAVLIARHKAEHSAEAESVLVEDFVRQLERMQ